MQNTLPSEVGTAVVQACKNLKDEEIIVWLKQLVRAARIGAGELSLSAIPKEVEKLVFSDRDALDVVCGIVFRACREAGFTLAEFEILLYKISLPGRDVERVVVGIQRQLSCF